VYATKFTPNLYRQMWTGVDRTILYSLVPVQHMPEDIRERMKLAYTRQGLKRKFQVVDYHWIK
jgi:hypothetical protein